MFEKSSVITWRNREWKYEKRNENKGKEVSLEGRKKGSLENSLEAKKEESFEGRKEEER